MLIKNVIKNTVLAEDAIYAYTLKKQTFGLLLYKTPRAMLFKTRFGIHTFGMRYPIDVIVLDPNDKVVQLKHNLKANRIFLWNPKYNSILELPAGTIKVTQTELGHKINTM